MLNEDINLDFKGMMRKKGVLSLRRVVYATRPYNNKIETFDGLVEELVVEKKVSR